MADRAVVVPTAEEYAARRAAFLPWERGAAAVAGPQAEFQRMLAREAGATFGKGVFVALEANLFTSRLRIGDRSWVAAGAVLRGDIEIGADCSINHGAHLAGNIRIGNGVRVAALASILGFNHGHRDLHRPIWSQPVTSDGIRIGDDVWLGASCVVLDGVDIGAHSIVAAGSVVTKSCGEYQILAGNPARVLRDRRTLGDG